MSNLKNNPLPMCSLLNLVHKASCAPSVLSKLILPAPRKDKRTLQAKLYVLNRPTEVQLGQMCAQVIC